MWWIVLLLIPISAVVIDSFAGLRSRRFETLELIDGSSENFTVLVPIYGSMSYLDNRKYLASYGDRVVLCTTSGETTEFYHELDEVVAQYGFRSYRSPIEVRTTSNKRSTTGVTRDTIIRDALHSMDGLNEYVVFLDADTTTPDRLERLVGALVASGGDFASVNIMPQEKGGLFVQLQRHEYRLSMRVRFLLPWLISGACHVGKTEVFREIMSRHSLFFQGSDVEAGLIGEQLGYRAVHLPFLVDTDVPASFKPWWRQRVAWAGGEFKIFITNFRYITKHPFLWTYGGIIVILMVGLRWWSLMTPSWALAAVAVLYYLSTFWMHWSSRNWWLLMMPVYSLLNSLVVTPIGVVMYFMIAVRENNFGVIRVNKEVESSSA